MTQIIPCFKFKIFQIHSCPKYSYPSVSQILNLSLIPIPQILPFPKSSYYTCQIFQSLSPTVSQNPQGTPHNILSTSRQCLKYNYQLYNKLSYVPNLPIPSCSISSYSPMTKILIVSYNPNSPMFHVTSISNTLSFPKSSNFPLSRILIFSPVLNLHIFLCPKSSNSSMSQILNSSHP